MVSSSVSRYVISLPRFVIFLPILVVNYSAHFVFPLSRFVVYFFILSYILLILSWLVLSYIHIIFSRTYLMSHFVTFRYVYVVSTKTKQWKMYIDSIPTDKWVNLVFVWRNNEGLTYYLDGEKMQTVNATAASRPSIEYTILTISRPNNAVNSEFMYPLKMCCLGLWDKPLKKQQIKFLYENSKCLEIICLHSFFTRI